MPRISDDPNAEARRTPRLDLLSPEGMRLLAEDPDQFSEEQRVIVEDMAGWDQAKRVSAIDARFSTEIVKEALERFNVVAELEDKQRKREVDDLKFDRGLLEDQWDPKDLEARRALGRPCLVISRLDMPIQQVENELKDSRLAVHIRPRGKNSNKDGAEVRQGLYRAIEVDSRAYIAREWAASRALRCGRGAYRIVKVYNNDGDFDMDLGIKRILNQGSVYFDPWAIEPDWSDGEWVLITEDIPRTRYKRLYGEDKLTSLDAMVSAGDVPPEWVTEDHVRIAEYFRVVYTKRWLVYDPETKQSKLLPANVAPPAEAPGVRMREVDERKVEWYVIDGGRVLDTEAWEGRFIPVVPVIGKEYNIDGKERVFKGMVSGAKDAQRMFNYFKSLQVQAAHLTTEDEWVGDIRAFEGFEKTDPWKNKKILPINAEVNGVAIAAPQRTIKQPELEAITLALRDLDNDIKATTGRHAASLGEYGPDRSGKAIREMKVQGEHTTSNYLKNFAHISLTYEAKVILDMMRHVYDTERIIRILGEQDKERTIMVNRDFYETPDGPLPAQLDADGRPLPPPAMAPQGNALTRFVDRVRGRPVAPGASLELKRYDLNIDADYAFVVTIGKSYQTQREEDAAVFRTIIEANPAMAEVLGPLWIKSLDGPAASEAYELLRKINPMLRQATEEGQPEIPPEVQKQLQESGQMIEQLTEALNQKNAQEAMESQKLAAQNDIKAMEIASNERIAMAEAEARMAEAQAKAADAAAKVQIEAAQAERDAQLAREKLAAETAQAERAAQIKAETEVRIAEAKLAFEREKMQLELQTKKEMAALDRENAQLIARSQLAAKVVADQNRPQA